MIALPDLDEEYLIDGLVALLEIPSPTGCTVEAFSYLEGILSEIPELSLQRTPKGTLTALWEGEEEGGFRGLTAHLDTLGAMVKEVKPNGRLKITPLGGFAWNTIEGEGCLIRTSSGAEIPGSILLTKASGHVYGKEVSSTERNEDTLEVRLDLRSRSAEETREAGIEVGDFVFFNPRVECHQGFIRSRHLDDKAGVACLLAAIKSLQDSGRNPRRTTVFHFSNYEEVGHGAAAGFPAEMEELVAVDMAPVGEGQQSDEFRATQCVKDSLGPYHQGLNQRLRALADSYQIPYCLDIYPHYGSDGEAFWRAGGEVAVALIGPGVDASHNYERTHQEALLATARWILAYLLN